MNLQQRRDAMFSASLKTEPVEVPEWGITVLAREMTGTARMQFLEQVGMKKKVSDMYPVVAIPNTFDPDEPTKPFFSLADRDALSNLSGAALERICSAVLRLSGLSDEATEAAKNA